MKQCTLIVGAMALLGAVNTPVAANHDAAVADPTTFFAEWSYVPDFDQRRALLANTGRMYCVPTSAMNWMTYIAHHGYPGVAPGDAPYWSWMQAPSYNPMTSWIDQMGTLMLTDPDGGTNGNNAAWGMNIWLAGHNFVVQNYWTHGGTTITFSDIADWTILGVPVTASVGWYDGTVPNITRDGGHALTVTYVARSGTSREIGWRDPADEQSILFAQSPFATQEYGLDPTVVFVKGYPRVMDKVLGYGSGWIDGMKVIFPMFGLTDADDGLSFNFFKPNKFSWDSSDIIQNFTPEIVGSIKDLKMIPGSPQALIVTDAIVGGPAETVWCYNPARNTTKVIGEAPGAESFVFGRNREVYFLTDTGEIHCYPLGEDEWDVTASVIPPDPVKALAYDDMTDSVLAISDDGSTIYRYANSLTGEPEVSGIDPSPFYPFEPDMKTSMAVDPISRVGGVAPDDNRVFITNEFADGILMVSGLGTARATSEIIAGGELVNPRCVQVGDDGQVFVVSDDTIREYRFSDEAGGWEESTQSNLTGLAVGNCLDIPHFRMNFEADTEEYDNRLPEEFAPSQADCTADLDGDMVVGGADLSILLASWGQGGDLTDLNGDGTTDGADLAAMLASWGGC